MGFSPLTLALGNYKCLKKRYLKNSMCYVPSDILRPHKMVWKQQKDHSLYWDVSFFSGWEQFQWLLSNSACVFCPKYWSELKFRSNCMVQNAHHPQMHTGLHLSTAQVHPAWKHSLFFSMFIAWQGLFMPYWEVTSLLTVKRPGNFSNKQIVVFIL